MLDNSIYRSAAVSLQNVVDHAAHWNVGDSDCLQPRPIVVTDPLNKVNERMLDFAWQRLGFYEVGVAHDKRSNLHQVFGIRQFSTRKQCAHQH